MSNLKKGLFSIIILLVLLAGLEKLYDFFLLENRNIKSSYITKEKINAAILIQGPCVPVWMISPEILDEQTGLKSYNLAQSHADLADIYLHLHLYLKNNNPPKYLFLYVSPESFDEKYNAFNTYRFVPFIGDSIVNGVVKELDPEYYKWTVIPFMKYGYYSNNFNFSVLQGAKHFLSDKKEPYFADGYEPPFEIWKNDNQVFVESYPKEENFIWSSRREEYLKKIIELALANHIKVILYESPVEKQSAGFQANRTVFINRTKEIADAYQINYLNFDTMSVSNSKADFKTTINLNKAASEDFTKAFGKYIKENFE